MLDDGEDRAGARVEASGGVGVAVVYHGMYERGGPAAVDALPGGAAWRASVESVPASERHLAVHDRHLVGRNRHDDHAWPDAAGLVEPFTFSGTADQLAGKVEAMAAAGVTELAYQPAGDIPTELRRMAAALGLAR